MKWWVALAAMLATLTVVRASAPPVVASMAEWWAGLVLGLVVLAHGVRSWSDAPVQVAAFPTPDTRRSPWPQLLILTAAFAGLLGAFVALVQAMAPGDWHPSGRLATVMLCGAVAVAACLTQRRMRTHTPRPETDAADETPIRRGALVVLGIWGLQGLQGPQSMMMGHTLGHPAWLGSAALALILWRGWDRPWQRAARWQAVMMVAAGAAVLMLCLRQ